MSNSLRDIAIEPGRSIREALAILNDTHRRIVLIVGANGRLVGVLTDSNFRHAMLSGQDFDQPVSDIMTATPVTIGVDHTVEAALELMQRTHCHDVPVVDALGRPVNLLTIEALLADKRPRHAAVVIAGGLGKRLLPLTENTPKPLIDVGGRPILFTILDQLLDAGCAPIYLMLNYRSEDVIAAVSAQPGYSEVIHFITEREPLGTAGPIGLLPELPSSAFLVVNADILTKVPIRDVFSFHGSEANDLTVAVKENVFAVPYGVVELEGTRVTGIHEKPSYVHYVNIGLYVMEPSLLELVNRSGPYDMNQMIQDAIARKKRVGCFPVREYWIDIGQPKNLEQAENDFSQVFAKRQ